MAYEYQSWDMVWVFVSNGRPSHLSFFSSANCYMQITIIEGNHRMFEPQVGVWDEM